MLKMLLSKLMYCSPLEGCILHIFSSIQLLNEEFHHSTGFQPLQTVLNGRLQPLQLYKEMSSAMLLSMNIISNVGKVLSTNMDVNHMQSRFLTKV